MIAISQTTVIFVACVAIAFLLLCFKKVRRCVAFVAIVIPSMVLYIVGGLMQVPFATVLAVEECGNESDSDKRREEIKRRISRHISYFKTEE